MRIAVVPTGSRPRWVSVCWAHAALIATVGMLGEAGCGRARYRVELEDAATTGPDATRGDPVEDASNQDASFRPMIPDAFARMDASDLDAVAPLDTAMDSATPDAFQPDAFAVDAFAPDAFEPDAFAVDAFATDALGGTPTFNECVGDAECGGACIPLPNQNVCGAVALEATGCMGSEDSCCTTSDCASGSRCFSNRAIPRCAGLPPPEANLCLTDACDAWDSCGAGAVCLPRNVLGPARVCLVADCRSNSDCTASPGGRCVLLRDPCCGGPSRMACAYGADACSRSSDCDPGFYCDRVDDRTVCVPGFPFCPS